MSARTYIAALALFLIAAIVPVHAQEKTKSDAPAAAASAPTPPPPANPADVASADAILAATYDVISGPAGQNRDWNRFLSLFVPGARLIPAGPDKEGKLGTRVITPEEYVKRADAYFLKNGFAEREIARRSERYGHIMQIFSTYESRHDAKDPKPFARGINSFQLFFDGTRWWVVTIYWEEETPSNPLPGEFLESQQSKSS